MNKFIFFLLISLSYVSCDKTSLTEEKLLPDNTEIRTDMPEGVDCRICAAVHVEYKLVENYGNCCVYELSVFSNNPCRQEVYIGNNLYYVIRPVETWTFRVCNNNPVNVRVLGYDLLTQQWDDVCFENTFNC